MKKIEFQSLISILANLGVIASIVFLGFELRQNNALMASEARATYASMDQNGWSLIIENPDLVRALLKDRKGETLTDLEEFQLNALWMQAFAQYQFRYFEDRDSANWVAGQRRLYAAYPSIRRTWQGEGPGARQAGKDNYDPGFVRFYERNVVNAMSNDGLQDFATRYAAAWSGGDPEAFADFYAEDATFRINDGETIVGRDAIEATARSFMTSFPDMQVRLVELRTTDDTIEFHWRWTGTNTGPGGTGNAVDLRGFEAWTLDEEGLILRMQGHMDEAEYQRQLNGTPPGA